MKAGYFFFRRLVFRAPFFAAAFVFDFLFFAIAALLATMSGDVGTVPPRIDVHYIPITPAQRKKHRLRLIEGVREWGTHHPRTRTSARRISPCAHAHAAMMQRMIFVDRVKS